MNGQIVEERGWGQAERAEGQYGFTEIYLQVDPVVTNVAAQEKEQLTDSTNKGMDNRTKGHTGVTVLRAYH